MNAQWTKATLLRLTPLTDTIMQVLLLPEPYRDYVAGQYLQIRQGEDMLSYSIANAPLGAAHYELHIRHQYDNPCTRKLLETLRGGDKLTLRLPLGSCSVASLDAEKPILFIAGGTGFAPIKAMIEQWVANGDTRAITLIWCVKSRADLYMDAQIRQWEQSYRHFCYLPLISSQIGGQEVIHAVLKQYGEQLSTYQAVIAGPFDMARAIGHKLVEAGLPAGSLFSDAW